MRVDRRPAFVAGLLCSLTIAPRSEAQPGRRGAASDRGQEAMRKEVEARDREWARRFDTLRRAPAPPPADVALPVAGPARPEMLRGIIVVDNQQVQIWVKRVQDAGAGPDLVVAPETFDLTAFGQGGLDKFLVRLDVLLDGQVRRTVSDRGLSPDDERRIRLAARGDIKRMLDDVEARRPAFERARKDLQNAARVLAGLRSMTPRISMPWSPDDSLFHKTLRKIERDRHPAGTAATPR